MPQRNVVGYEGTVVVAGVDVNTTGWSATETTTDLDRTNTSHYVSADNRAYHATQPGVTKCEGSFKFNFDSNLLFYSGASSFRAGLQVAAVFTIAATGQRMNFPSIQIKSINFGEAGMDALRECTCEWIANGPYTYT